MTMTIGLFAFSEMEMLDFAGPYQVFSTASAVTNAQTGQDLFEMVTISPSQEAVTVRSGAVLLPQATIADHPRLDCLIIPGGMTGVDPLIEEGPVVDWIAAQADSVPLIATVCTGAFLLAQTGLLNGLEATTHQDRTDQLRRRFPDITVIEQRRWVDCGRFVTAAGLSAGIDMTLHLVERLADRDLAVATARAMEL